MDVYKSIYERFFFLRALFCIKKFGDKKKSLGKTCDIEIKFQVNVIMKAFVENIDINSFDLENVKNDIILNLFIYPLKMTKQNGKT